VRRAGFIARTGNRATLEFHPGMTFQLASSTQHTGHDHWLFTHGFEQRKNRERTRQARVFAFAEQPQRIACRPHHPRRRPGCSRVRQTPRFEVLNHLEGRVIRCQFSHGQPCNRQNPSGIKQALRRDLHGFQCTRCACRLEPIRNRKTIIQRTGD
jgi:hypothetical protein